MRIAATGNCTTVSADGHYSVYGLDVSIQQGAATYPVTTRLGPDDDPVALPAAVAFDQPAVLLWTIEKKSCVLVGITPFCGTPAPISNGSYPMLLEPRGSYATAKYSSTIFTVDDNTVDADWQPTHVTSVSLDPSVPAAATFTAKGWSVANNVSSRPQVNTIDLGEDFAIYKDDFSSPHDPRPSAKALAQYGVSPAAGLQWPKVYGTRNGATYWYSVDTPTLARDAISFCWFAPPTFYRLPFQPVPGWQLWNGNYDDPNGGHPDSGATTIGNNQKYAFDFGPDANGNGVGEVGAAIVAARNGIVVDEQTAETGNSWASGPWVDDGTTVTHLAPSGYMGVGNFVILLHEDGTYGVYWHLKPNSATVAVGDYVQRGDILGNAGYTGNASTPHLHFDVRINWDVNYPQSGIEYPSTPVRFQDQNHPGGCWLPRDGQQLLSNQY
jgi:murein DD-endopeptidase MepM/ murein hydrolase activator NlpD